MREKQTELNPIIQNSSYPKLAYIPHYLAHLKKSLFPFNDSVMRSKSLLPFHQKPLTSNIIKNPLILG